MMTEEMELILDFRSKTPLSEQVQEEIRHLIQVRTFQPGDRLPTVRTLANQLRVNFNTVARAYRVLDEEGWLSTQQGRGTYVLEREPGDQVTEAADKAEQIDQLVNRFIEEARRKNISPTELREAIERLLPGADQHKENTRARRMVKVFPKKRISAVLWEPDRSKRTVKRSIRRIRKIG